MVVKKNRYQNNCPFRENGRLSIKSDRYQRAFFKIICDLSDFLRNNTARKKNRCRNRVHNSDTVKLLRHEELSIGNRPSSCSARIPLTIPGGKGDARSRILVTHNRASGERRKICHSHASHGSFGFYRHHVPHHMRRIGNLLIFGKANLPVF